MAPAEVALAVVAAESDEDDDDDAITPELGTISGHRYLSNDSTVPRIAKTLFPLHKQQSVGQSPVHEESPRTESDEFVAKIVRGR